MRYDATLSISFPAALAPIAAMIGRALDPDVGGHKSFSPSEDGLTISICTPCTSEFVTQAAYMLAHPESLHAAVSQDYAVRWADLTAPTLAECEQFCYGVITESAALPRNQQR